MRPLDFYLSRAKEREGVTSDRQLSLRIPFNETGVSMWRMGRAWPSDAHMIRLCEMAGVDPHEGLLDLMQWRADKKTAAVWKQLAQRIASAAAVMLIAFGLQVFSAPSASARALEVRTLCDNRISSFLVFHISLTEA